MSQHQPVPPDAISLGTALWFFVGLLFFFALALYLSGLYGNKRKRVRGQSARRTLQTLFKWGVLREEDTERLLLTESSTMEEEEPDYLASAQETRQNRLVATPVLQHLLFNWDRLWVPAFWGAALAIALAGLLSTAMVPVAALFTDLSGYEFSSAFAFLLGLMLQLLVVGLFAGWALGLYWGQAHAERSPQPSAHLPAASPRRVAAYRTPAIAWLPVIFLGLAFTASLTLSLLTRPYQPLSLIGLLLWPTLTLGVLLLCEYLIHRLEQLPPWSLCEDPILAQRASAALFPRLIQLYMGIEYGMLGFFCFVQLMFLPDALTSGGKGSVSTTYTFLAMGCLLVVLLLAQGAYGRLGGRRTGWPWSKRARAGDAHPEPGSEPDGTFT